MALHESSVNFRNLIRDLADMYPFEVGEVVLVELIANSLDAGATLISIRYDSESRRLVVQDNGRGMTEPEFEEYHDFAASLKPRGEGIGFAGLGAKISFNIAQRVMTETRSESFSGGSDWRLRSKTRLEWEDARPTHLRTNGTRVEILFASDPGRAYSSSEGLVGLLRRHYLPLLDTRFLELYERIGAYSRDLRFLVGGKTITPGRISDRLGLTSMREFYPSARKKRVGYGLFGVAKRDYPVAPEVVGVLVCTYGKVIKGDLFNQFPGTLGPRLFGMVEVPGLAKFLTTSKTEFARLPGRRTFESLYGPVREEFKTWLAEIGVQPTEPAGGDEASRLERELRKLVEEIPELGEFFGFRTTKRILSETEDGGVRADMVEGTEVTFPEGTGQKGQEAGPLDVGDEPGEAVVESEDGPKTARPISRKARRGPRIGFAEVPDRLDLAWVEGESVIINTGHPAYARSERSPSARRLHNLFAIGSAIQRFLSDSDSQDVAFVDRMMAAWGRK